MPDPSPRPEPIRIGVTGHMNLTPNTVELVRAEITRILREVSDGAPIIGVSCIAGGADSIFAEAVLDLGGQLEVIIPSADYRATKVKPDHAATFDHLVAQATTVITLPFEHANRAAYEAANERLLASCDALTAVWDGRPAVDQGGTAAVVESARERGLKIEVAWPAGAARKP